MQSNFISMKISSLLTAVFSTVLLCACHISGQDTALNYKIGYQIVIDAGSSGTRAHVYQIEDGGSMPRITDLYEASNSVALSGFVNDPEAAGPTAIQPLLNDVENFLSSTSYPIPASQVTTSVLGTAGMRTLSASDQARIYRGVSDTIAAAKLPIGQVGTISGQLEGLYSWIDVNYLQNNFNVPNATTGIVDIGGASAQVVFAAAGAASTTPSATAQTLLVELNGYVYAVVSATFLGLGQDSARDQMNAGANSNQCYPTGYSNATISGAYHFSVCAKNYDLVLSNDGYAALQQIKTVPGFYRTPFSGLNSVYYALSFWNIAAHPSQQLLEQNISATCTTPYAQLSNTYPGAYKLYNQCANATYIDRFLYADLALADNQLSALNNVNGHALNYTLGYVLLGSMRRVV